MKKIYGILGRLMCMLVLLSAPTLQVMAASSGKIQDSIDLELHLQEQKELQKGDKHTYKAKIFNNGINDAHNVKIIYDVKPSSIKNVSMECGNTSKGSICTDPNIITKIEENGYVELIVTSSRGGEILLI